jgi:hypothetical protein
LEPYCQEPLEIEKTSKLTPKHSVKLWVLRSIAADQAVLQFALINDPPNMPVAQAIVSGTPYLNDAVLAIRLLK